MCPQDLVKKWNSPSHDGKVFPYRDNGVVSLPVLEDSQAFPKWSVY